MSTRKISMGVKAAGTVGLQTYHHPVPLSWNLGTLSSLNPPDISRPVMGLIYRYVRVYIQLPCVPNRPCCFRNLGIQHHFVWCIERGLCSSSSVRRNFFWQGLNKFICGQKTVLYLYLCTLLRKMQFMFCVCSTWT